MRVADVDVEDDDAAREEARRLDHAHCIEVWSGTRMVGIVEPAKRKA